jgi:radical SAM protein with 4Fe4S-binding SPASM domain
VNVSKVSDDFDPFFLLKRIRKGIKDCNEVTKVSSTDLSFLWIDVSSKGIAQPDDACPCAKHLSLEEWLNVVDEAAAYGVKWLILTVRTSLTAFPDVCNIGRWAQEAHGISVGLHTHSSSLTQEEIDSVKQMDLSHLTLYVKREFLDGFKNAAQEGIKVAVADPQTYGNRPKCQGPTKMIFINPEGVLYTCGLVEGNQDFRLGTIFEGSFSRILRDPQLPHKVPSEIHRVSMGCDGCPSLVVNFRE